MFWKKAELQPPLNRNQYQPSGGVNWPRFLPCFAVTCASVAVMAWALWFAQTYFMHVIVLSTCIAAFVPMGLAMWTVRAGCCRSPRLISLLGGLAGAALPLGQYYVGMIQSVPPQQQVAAATRLDVLPFWIHANMLAQKIRPVHAPAAKAEQQADPPNTIQVAFNYFFFFLELAIALGLIAFLPREKARAAYDEDRGRWMDQYKLQLPAGTSERLSDALAQDRLASLAQQLEAAPNLAANPYCELLVEASRISGIEPTAVDSSGIWLTATEFSMPNGQGQRNSAVRFRQWQLSAMEYAALQSRFPALPTLGAAPNSNAHIGPNFNPQVFLPDTNPYHPPKTI